MRTRAPSGSRLNACLARHPLERIVGVCEPQLVRLSATPEIEPKLTTGRRVLDGRQDPEHARLQVAVRLIPTTVPIDHIAAGGEEHLRADGFTVELHNPEAKAFAVGLRARHRGSSVRLRCR